MGNYPRRDYEYESVHVRVVDGGRATGVRYELDKKLFRTKDEIIDYLVDQVRYYENGWATIGADGTDFDG